MKKFIIATNNQLWRHASHVALFKTRVVLHLLISLKWWTNYKGSF